jgi:hypothetical protein
MPTAASTHCFACGLGLSLSLSLSPPLSPPPPPPPLSLRVETTLAHSERLACLTLGDFR